MFVVKKNETRFFTVPILTNYISPLQGARLTKHLLLRTSLSPNEFIHTTRTTIIHLNRVIYY